MKKIKFRKEWLIALKAMGNKNYWNTPNTVEFFAFVVKATIIIPGLLFDTQWWWLYLFALATSFMLIWSSTVKTLPTLIWFNILWVFLAIAAIIKNI
jgi:hypothetical protein